MTNVSHQSRDVTCHAHVVEVETRTVRDRRVRLVSTDVWNIAIVNRLKYHSEIVSYHKRTWLELFGSKRSLRLLHPESSVLRGIMSEGE